MNEETQITTRTTEAPQDSQLVGVSVRAWLAILLTIKELAINGLVRA